MKIVFKKLVSLPVMFFIGMLIFGQSYGQVAPDNPTNLVQMFTARIDKMGDADVEVTQKMTASQWEAFRQSPIFNDPSIAKRNMERSMATYVVKDFKRNIDEMDRKVAISLKVIGYSQYKGDGYWAVKIEFKDPQVTKLADNAYMITGNAVMGTSLVQQIVKIYFPAGAKNVEQTTDEFGKAIFSYTLSDGLVAYLKWNNIVGLLFILSAGAWFIKSNATKVRNIKTSHAA